VASNKARIHQRARRDRGRSPHVRRRVPRASGDRSRHGVLSAPHNGRFGTLVCDLPQGWPTDGCSPACGRLSNGRTAMSPGVTRVISTEANALVAPIHIHNRIPVVLEEEDWPIWLGGQPGDPAETGGPGGGKRLVPSESDDFCAVRANSCRNPANSRIYFCCHEH